MKIHRHPELSIFRNCRNIKASTYTASLDTAVKLARDKESVTLLLGSPDNSTDLTNQWLSYAKSLKAVLKKDTGVLFASGKLKLLFPKDKANHAKVYLLDDNAILIGSANLSKTAFSDKQTEVLVQLDREDADWRELWLFEDLRTWVEEMFEDAQPFPFEGFGEKAGRMDADALIGLIDHSIQEAVRKYAKERGREAGEGYVEISPSISQKIPKTVKEELQIERPKKGGKKAMIKADKLNRNERPGLELRDGQLVYKGDSYPLSSVDNLAEDLHRVQMFLDGFKYYLAAEEQDKREMVTAGWEVLLWFLTSPFAHRIHKHSKKLLKENFPHLLITGVPCSGKSFLTSLGEHLLVPRDWDSFGIPAFTNITAPRELRGLCKQSDNVYPIVNDEADLAKTRQHMDSYLKEEHWSEGGASPALCFVTNRPAQYFPPELQRRSILCDCQHSFTRERKTDQMAYLRGIVQGWQPKLGRHVAHRLSDELKKAPENPSPEALFGDTGDLLHLSRRILIDCFEQCNIPVPGEFPSKHLNTWQLISSSRWRKLYYNAPERFKHDGNKIHYEWADNSEYYNMGRLLPEHVCISKGQREGATLNKRGFYEFIGIRDDSSLLSKMTRKFRRKGGER